MGPPGNRETAPIPTEAASRSVTTNHPDPSGRLRTIDPTTDKLASRTVDWWAVHTYVGPVLTAAGASVLQPFQVSHEGTIYRPGDTAEVPELVARAWLVSGWMQAVVEDRAAEDKPAPRTSSSSSSRRR